MKTAKKITVYHCKCERCDEEWDTPVENPKRCKECKSPYWNKKRTRKQKETK